MASPVADAYNAPSGADVYAGRYPGSSVLAGGATLADVSAAGDIDGGAIPSWVPPEGKFADISLNELIDVNPCPSNGCTWSGGGYGPEEMFRVWCGGVFAPEYGSKGAFLMMGGGHLSYDGNEVYAFDIASRSWVCHGTPSDYSGTDIQADGEYPDGTSPPPHTYGMTGYLPPAWGGGTLGSLLLFGFPGGSVEQRVHAINLETGVWSRFTSANLQFGNSYGAAVRDVSRSGWWVVPSVCTRMYFVSSSGTVTAQHTNTNLNSGGQSMAALIPSRDILVNLEYGPGLLWLDLASLSSNPSGTYWNVITTSGTGPTASDLYKWGFEWSTLLDCFVCYQGTGQNTIYKLTPPAVLTDAWVWSSEVLTAQHSESPSYLSANANGHWRRFVEIPELHTFLWAESGAGPVQAWRPSGM